MKRTCRCAICWLALWPIVCRRARRWAQVPIPPPPAVQSFYDALTASMKAGGTAKSRYEKLKPAVEKAFDLPGMTALWRSARPGRRSRPATRKR